jgi:hypothetical protein
VNRYTDVQALATVDPAPFSLPALDWASIGQEAPITEPPPNGAPSDPLPKADVVVITWTNAEWSALDHVFVNSQTSRGQGTGSWSYSWAQYDHKVGSYSSDVRSEPLWGTYRVVTIPGASQQWKVIVFHSNAHLQYDPYIAGLRVMVRQILTDAEPTYLYSIGTAGGGNLSQMLGDAVVTNGGTLDAGVPPNSNDPANGQTFWSPDSWFPPSTLAQKAQQLMTPLAQVATQSDLESLFDSYAAKNRVRGFTLADLQNAPLTPANLGRPTIHSAMGTPLNTSCNFGMAPGQGSTQFCVYEEDDAVVGQVAAEMGVQFAFVRNVSDTVVPDQEQIRSITDILRQQWATALYERYGLITANNGAIAAWSTIAETR